MNDYFHKNTSGKLALNCKKTFDEISRTDITYGSYILNSMLQDKFLQMLENWNKTWTDTVPEKNDLDSQLLGLEWILTGSMSENLNVPFYVKKSTKITPEFLKANSHMSDYDVLVNCSELPIIAEDDIYNGEKLGIFATLPETHAGYTLIQIQPGSSLWEKYHQTYADKDYLDGEKFVSSVLSKCLKDFERQGPAFAVYKEESKLRDNVISFPCCAWPEAASGFLNRKHKNNWPSQSTVDRIVAEGSHVVKVAHKESIHENLEFRYSFSVAESILAKEFTLPQRRVYVILKILYGLFLKEFDGISSYYMKTVLFWTIEETEDQSIWDPCNTVLALNLLLDNLSKYLKQGNLPNYFIRENNMVDILAKDKSKMQQILQVIAKIRRNHVALILEFLETNQFTLIHGDYIIAPPQEEVKIWASMKYRQPNDDLDIMCTNLHRCSLHLALAWLVEIATALRSQELLKLTGVAAEVYGCVTEAVKWGFEMKTLQKVDLSNKENFVKFFMEDFAETVKQFNGSQTGKVTILGVFKLVEEHAKKNNFII